MIPDGYRNHRLVRRKCFYTLPSDLLEAVAESIPNIRTADPSLWLVETALSAICDDHSMQVGFASGVPLEYYALRPKKLPEITAEMVAELGWEDFNPAQQSLVARTYFKQSNWYNSIARGYAGWLNSNTEFCRERDQVLKKPQRAFSLAPQVADSLAGATPAKVQAFLMRWRLMAMAGPRLPVPMRPMLAGVFPMGVVAKMAATGGVFYLPDTFPLPSRDELRSILKTAVQSESPEHLREWMKMTGENNSAKNQIGRYSRMFEIQHFWEVLHERHPRSLDRQSNKLHGIFAKLLNVSYDTIRADLRLINKRMSQD